MIVNIFFFTNASRKGRKKEEKSGKEKFFKIKSFFLLSVWLLLLLYCRVKRKTFPQLAEIMVFAVSHEDKCYQRLWFRASRFILPSFNNLFGQRSLDVKCLWIETIKRFPFVFKCHEGICKPLDSVRAESFFSFFSEELEASAYDNFRGKRFSFSPISIS